MARSQSDPGEVKVVNGILQVVLKFGVKIARDSEVIIEQSFPGAGPQGGMGSAMLKCEEICPSFVK